MNRIAMRLVGLIAVIGFLCLNDTNGLGIDHHAMWAREHGMPAPSSLIFDAGLVLPALGAGIVGHSRRAKRQ